MNREEIQNIFVAEFCSGVPQPSAKEDIIHVEKELDILFPNSFIEFSTRFGFLHTPSILDLVTGGESEVAPEGASFDIQEFFTPESIIETTQAYHSVGMDGTLVAIASDCMGNVFGFHKSVKSERADDAKLFVFDHDFNEISEEAESFDCWLRSFINLKRNTEQSRS